MKRSIIYAGMFSVLVSVPTLTDKVLADSISGNMSDAVVPPLIPVINWPEMQIPVTEVAPPVEIPTNTTNTITPTVEKSAESTAQQSERMRSQTPQELETPEKTAEDMKLESERLRKVGAPRF